MGGGSFFCPSCNYLYHFIRLTLFFIISLGTQLSMAITHFFPLYSNLSISLSVFPIIIFISSITFMNKKKIQSDIYSPMHGTCRYIEQIFLANPKLKQNCSLFYLSTYIFTLLEAWPVHHNGTHHWHAFCFHFFYLLLSVSKTLFKQSFNLLP